jgi:hypothetical protein
MNIKKSVILTFRIFEKFWGDITKEQFDTVAVEMGLTDKDFGAMGTILKSMILMTSGSVATVRNPDSFDPLKTSPWEDIARSSLGNLFTLLGLDITEQISKQDYKTANTLLKKMGSSSIEMSDIEAKIGPDGFNTMKPEKVQISKMLWRGLKELSYDVIMLMLDRKTPWDISRAVSTSEIKDMAYEFATDVRTSNGRNNRALLHIKNPKRKGFRAGRLSKFQEDEVILSGQLRFIDWSLTANVSWTGKNIKDESMTRDDWLDIDDGKFGLSGADIQIPWNMEDTSKFIRDILNGGYTISDPLSTEVTIKDIFNIHLDITCEYI